MQTIFFIMARERVVALVDMDCFYVQVEQRLNPSLLGKPCAVVQYQTWKGGGIIAVGYEARKFGVTRNMRGDEAKEKCPDIVLARVPVARGKADLTRYREAGAEVISILQTFSEVCERASVDEAYLDLTETVERSLDTVTLESLAEETLKCCHVVGFTDQASSGRPDVRGQWMAALSDENNKRLAMGALIIQKAREAIKSKAGFTCSAGIAHNKMLAKLAGGAHKPNQQTLLPHQSVAKFFQTIPIRKVRYFGGKFGHSVINLLQVENMAELTNFSEEELRRRLGEKSGSWLYNVCRGIEHGVVRSRQLPKSTGCGKNFSGKMKLVSKEKVRYWMLQLAGELNDRLKSEEDKNHRTAQLVSVSLRTESNTTGVRSFPLRSTDPQLVCDSAMQVIKNFNSGTGDTWYPAIISLNMSASKFQETSRTKGSSSIASFFAKKENHDNREEIDPDQRFTLDEARKAASHEETLIESSSQTNKEAQAVLDSDEEQVTNVELECTDDESRQSLSCSVVEANDGKSGTFNYVRDEIDQSIVDQLPDDIRNEIESFLRTQKPPERNKRCSNGIEKYAVSQASTPSTFSMEKYMFTRANDDDLGTEVTLSDRASSGKSELIQCSRCCQKLSPKKMPEHLDFHFAMELHESERVTDNFRKEEPPKKRQKCTIDSFFISKDR